MAKLSSRPPIATVGDTAEQHVIEGGVSYRIEKVNYFKNLLLFRSDIAVAADFPTPAEVKIGWLFKTTASVTDNDPTKTNTGQSFAANQDIYWNGTNWTILGTTEIVLFEKVGVDIRPIVDGDNLDMRSGKVITDNISEKTTDNGIGITVSGNTGSFYDYPTPHNSWFVFSGSGSPDDGTNIYLPYNSTDGTWFGYGMGATDQIYFGSNGTEITMTGNGILLSQHFTANPIATPIATTNGTFYYDSDDNEFKFRENGVWITLGAAAGIFTRTGTDITVTNAGDNLDWSTAGIKIDSVATVFDVVAATGITPVADMVIPIQSSTAGDTNITAIPQIVAGTNGQRLTLIGVDDVKTVTLDDGDGLALDNGQSFTMGQNDIIEFVFYNSLWIETTRKDN